MKKWCKKGLIGFLCVFALLGSYRVIKERPLVTQDLNIIYEDKKETDVEPVVFMQFFDWFLEDSWVENDFSDKLQWSALGIDDNDRQSEAFYYKQFEYIKSLGVDALAWEYHPRRGDTPLYPNTNAVSALEKAGLKIAPFFDYEVALKSMNYDEQVVATLSNKGMIRPDLNTSNYIVEQLKDFYKHIPQNLWAYDGKSRTVIYVFGYDFNDTSNPDMWNYFAETLSKNMAEYLGNEPVFYWTYKNSPFAEHLFLKHREHFIPFQFVLDTPQGQFGHDSVTWNVGFDNLDVQIRDGLKRVIRLDERYIKEMGWLASATQPSAVFIYGWNEPFEGSIVMPTERWGDTKAKLVKHFIERLKNKNEKKLKKVLLIVDDLDNYYMQENKDWHYVIEREMLLYSMRRFIPQSDVYMTTEISEELLDQYQCIVDISVDKNIQQREWLLERMNEKQIMYFDPKALFADTTLINYFADPGDSMTINGDVQLLGSFLKPTSNFFVRDDIAEIEKLQKNSQCMLEAVVNGSKIPVIISNKDDIFVNAYNTSEDILVAAFEAFYGVEMKKSILYGEGYASQRLEIEELDGKPKKNTMERYSINQYWELPEDVLWNTMPLYIDEKYRDFVFGR